MHPFLTTLLCCLLAAPLLAQPHAPEEPRDPTDKRPVYQISAFLSPQLLRDRGFSERRIEQMRERCRQYVTHYAPIARTEQAKFGIPASITLAQAVLESDAGQTRLAKKFNNHFGIKCFGTECPDGHCAQHADDLPTDHFRHFDTNWYSFRAHSEFLQKPRYQACFQLHPQDYRGWAYALQRAGYATDPGYAVKLIHLIEALELFQYD